MDYNRLKKLITLEGVLLFIQFWLGMEINLFVEIPAGAPLNFLGYSGGAGILAHIANGILILIVASLILIYSVRLTNSLFSKLSIVGIVFVVVAIIGGVFFIIMGLNNSFSMAMAMSFISVYTLYFYEFYLTGKAEAPAAS